MNYYLKDKQQALTCNGWAPEHGCGEKKKEEKRHEVECSSSSSSSRSIIPERNRMTLQTASLSQSPSPQQQQQQRSLELSMFPDEILVNIGKSVAKLCGTRDFIMLSRTSKRLRRLLLHPETISGVIRDANSGIFRNRSLLLLPSHSLEPTVVHSLEQLALYESILEQNLLEENRFTPSLGPKVRAILKKHPTAVLVLDAHSGRGELMATTPYGHFDYRAKHAYEKIVVPTMVKPDRIRTRVLGRAATNASVSTTTTTTTTTSSERIIDTVTSDRIRIRVWGRAVAEKASESEHPYSVKAQKGKGWVEVFFRMGDGKRETSTTTAKATTTLELPPRPDFYRNLLIPQEQRYERFFDFDDSDYDDE